MNRTEKPVKKARAPGRRRRRSAETEGPDGLRGFDSLLRALGDPTRLRILGLLAAAGEICVCDIHTALRIPQSRASRHLAYLRRAGLVLTRRGGVWIHYRLSEPADQLARALTSSVCASLSHLPAVARDRRALEARLGCCVPPREPHAPNLKSRPSNPKPEPDLKPGTWNLKPVSVP